MRYSVAGLMLAVVPLFPAPPEQHAQHVVLAALEKLTYVGTAGYDGTKLDHHSMKELKPPSTLQPHTYYVFHQRRSSAHTSWETILSTLRNHGIEIVRAPKSAEELTYIPVGGPLYTIEFRHGSMRGTVFNAVDHRILTDEALANDWLPEDVVLVLDQE